MFEHLDDPSPPTGEDRRAAVRREGLRLRATRQASRVAVVVAVVALAGGVAVAAGIGGAPARDIEVAGGPGSSVQPEPTTTTVAPTTTTTTTAAAVTTTTAPTGVTTHCTQFPPSPDVSAPEGIDVVLTLDRAVFARSEPVGMTLRVRNNRSEAVTYDTGGGNNPPHWWIRDEHGTVVYDTSHVRPFAVPAVVVPYTIGPGEGRTLTTSWEHEHCAEVDFSPPFSLPPGRYVAQASWRPDWRAAAVAFEIR